MWVPPCHHIPFSDILLLQDKKRGITSLGGCKAKSTDRIAYSHLTVMLLKVLMFSSWSDYGFLQNPATRTLDSLCPSTALKPMG